MQQVFLWLSRKIKDILNIPLKADRKMTNVNANLKWGLSLPVATAKSEYCKNAIATALIIVTVDEKPMHASRQKILKGIMEIGHFVRFFICHSFGSLAFWVRRAPFTIDRPTLIIK